METTNLFSSDAHQDIIDAMRTDLFDILGETGGMNIPLRIPQGFRAAEKGNMNE